MNIISLVLFVCVCVVFLHFISVVAANASLGCWFFALRLVELITGETLFVVVTQPRDPLL